MCVSVSVSVCVINSLFIIIIIILHVRTLNFNVDGAFHFGGLELTYSPSLIFYYYGNTLFTLTSVHSLLAFDEEPFGVDCCHFPNSVILYSGPLVWPIKE